MLSFKNFLKEETELKLRVDNPGGRWLQGKQDAAEERMKNGPSETASSRGITGSTTGYFNKRIPLPTSYLNSLPGAMGEENFRGFSSKLKRLEDEVGHPDNFKSEDHPILVGVNHKGHAHIVEGNHRVAYANKHGIKSVHAEVKYFNGGEEVKGFHHPDKIIERSKIAEKYL